MPLKNPYPTKIDSADETGSKLQCDISPADKALIMSLRPAKGTIQLVVNNLLKNLCDDLRELNIHGWRLDGDELLTILTDKRPFSEHQLDKLRKSTAGTTKPVSERLLEHRRGTSVREKAPELEVKSANPTKRSTRGKQRVGEEAPTAGSNSQSEQDPTEG
jgi:hypothetical protein